MNSSSVLLLVSFGDTTFPVGGVTQTFLGSTKGQAAAGVKSPVSRTYSFTFTDPSTGQTGTGTGSVVGFVTPNGK